MTQSAIATQYRVTEIQMDRAHRVVDMAARQVFFQVESSKQDGTEYTVRYDRLHKVLTCTCPAGNPPIVDGSPLYAPRNCWHMRAACAVAAEHKAEEERNMHELSWEMKQETREYTIEVDPTSCSLDGMKFETAGRGGRLVPMR